MTGTMLHGREAVARKRLESFDFGARVTRAGEWVETTRDTLSCMVHLAIRAGSRPVTFRVVFQPGSSLIREIGVAECLPLA